MPEPTSMTLSQFVAQQRQKIARNLDIDTVMTTEERDERIVEAYNELPEGFIVDDEPIEHKIHRLNTSRDTVEKRDVDKIFTASANGQQPMLTMDDPLAFAWVILGTGKGRRKPLWFVTEIDLEAWVQRKREAEKRTREARIEAEAIQASLSPVLRKHLYWGAGNSEGLFCHSLEEDAA